MGQRASQRKPPAWFRSGGACSHKSYCKSPDCNTHFRKEIGQDSNSDAQTNPSNPSAEAVTAPLCWWYNPCAMKNWLRLPSSALFLGIFALLLLVILASAADSLTFERGKPFAYAEESSETTQPPAEPLDLTPLVIFSIIVFAAFITIALIAATPQQRLKLLLALLIFALVLLLIMWWLSSVKSTSFVPTPTLTLEHTPQEAEESVLVATEIPAVVYEPPPVSPWISIGVAFFVLLAAAALVWFAVRRRLSDTAPLDDLAAIAGQTVSDLQAGKDYGDAILNCYAAMMSALDRQRGIRRRGHLTPAEFIAVLERARLPSAAVRRLTALFERVRYGSKKASAQEIEEAIACLNEISAAIREAQ